MRRRMFNLLSAMSLILCLYSLRWLSGGSFHQLLWDGGGGIAGGSDTNTYILFIDDGIIRIEWSRTDIWPEGRVIVPVMCVTGLAAILPVLWCIRPWLWRQKTRKGHCCNCGYDLTGNVSGVCPECGTAVPPAAGGGQQAGKGATA